MNALARAIFFGKHGELRERALQDQLQRASAVNFIINAISIWNTVYLSRAIEHINFLGQYKFDINSSHSIQSLRPFRT